MPDSPDRLARAVEDGMLPQLAPYGFHTAGGNSSHRGAHVELTNGTVLITAAMDYLEGELQVDIRGPGGPARPFTDLVEAAHLHGIRTSRLSRAVQVGELRSPLTRIADALVHHAADVLEGSEAGLKKLA